MTAVELETWARWYCTGEGDSTVMNTKTFYDLSYDKAEKIRQFAQLLIMDYKKYGL